MKDAKGHGSEARGGGGGAAESRFHGSIAHQVARGQYDDKPVTFGHALADQFQSKRLGANSEAGLTAKFGSSTAHQMVLAAQHGIPTQHINSAPQINSTTHNSSGHEWGSPAALQDFKREHGGPANKGQLARIDRFHKAVGR
jgi:hypothetical protein